MTMTAQRQANLHAAIAQIIGQPVEITIRGARSFTFSVEHVDHELAAKLVEFFGPMMVLESVETDDDCGTFVYMAAA
jgi:hypothetical protein